MKLVDKIKTFENIDDLIQGINSDKNSRDILSRRFPIRLIFLQRFETFRSLIERMSSIGIENYHIEKDLPHPDGWITKDFLINTVIRLRKDTVVVPFSEIVRFYSESDFNNFFNQLLLIENTDLSRRIYLPLIGIEERFEKDFFQSFTRKDESPGFWKISKEPPNSIKVFLSTSKNIGKISNYETIPNVTEWLKFWKKKSPCDVICCATPLNLFYKNTLPDTIFTIEQSLNLKNLLEKIFGKEIPISFIESEADFWDRLGALIDQDYTSFNDFVKKYFGVKSLTTSTVLPRWLQTNDFFEKWLLKHFILSQSCLEKKYIYKVFESIQDYSDNTLLKCLYHKIYDLDINEEFVIDRFDLIKQFAALKVINLSDEVKSELNENIHAITDLKQTLLLSTGLFSFEKKYLLELFVKDQIFDFDLLAERFPDILYYTSNVIFDNINTEQEWIYEYLNEYKKSKISESITDKLVRMLLELNENEKSFFSWYHNFDSIHSLLHTYKVDKVLWIDALGIEWVSFIESYLNNSKKELRSIKTLMGVANIPTCTEQNRFSDSKYIQEFDQLIHNNTYLYPESFIKEMDEIKKIMDLYLILDSEQTVAIVSDHGLTSLSRLVHSKKYGKDDSHEGRFIELKGSDYTKDSDYLNYKSEIDSKNYLIALKHNSLGKKPLREVHGGCTPEEVLVPLILITNKKEKSHTDYFISIEKTDISKREPVVLISIKPKPFFAEFEVKGKTKKLKFNNANGKWEASLDKSLSGKVLVNVRVGKIEKSFTINIISGLIEEDLF